MKKAIVIMTILLACQMVFANVEHRSIITAKQFYEFGNYTQALGTMETVEQVYRDSAEYALLMGRIHLALGNYNNSYSWLTKYSASYLGVNPIADSPLIDEIHMASLYQDLSPVSLTLGRIGDNVNSPNSEYAPILFNNGRTMIFGSTRRSDFAKENIFFTNYINNSWTEPVEIRDLCTDQNETAGSFSKDGNTLYLSGQYERRGGAGSIYRSTLRNNRWSKPEMLSSISSAYHDLQPYVYNDEVMFFVSNRAGNNSHYDIYISENRDGFWQTPVNLGEVVNTEGDEQTPFLSADGRTLYFASNGHPGYGGSDIFKSERLGSSWLSWTKPQNLGPIINSVKDDRYFFIDQATGFAYLSSNRVGSSGYEDIYYLDYNKFNSIRRQIETILAEEYPCEIIVTGKVIDEYNQPVETNTVWSFIYQDDTYEVDIASDESGAFEFCIPAIERIKYLIDNPNYAEQEEVLLIPRYTESFDVLIRLINIDNVMEIYGRVTDSDGEGLNANLYWSYMFEEQLIEKHIVSNGDGHYEVILPYDMPPAFFSIERANYMPISGQIDEYDESRSMERNFTMLLLEEHAIFNIENIHFEFASAVLLSESYRVLDPIVSMMQQNPSLRIELAGHTDNVGSREVNMRLSRERAQSVANYLIERGVEADRMEVSGYGFDMPVAENETPEGRALNRRVEMRILGIEYITDAYEGVTDGLVISQDRRRMIQSVQATSISQTGELTSVTRQHFRNMAINIMGDQTGSLRMTLLFDRGRVQSAKVDVISGSISRTTVDQISDLMIGWRIDSDASFIETLILER